MKKFFTPCLFICVFALMAFQSIAQNERYIDEVFTDVDVQSGLTYGVNATVLFLPVVYEAVPQPLTMDVYAPAGDTLTERPLILYFHTGNFLPHPQNGSVSGTNTDSTVVEMCSRLARMGYVVASCSYRLGWNPVATTQTERVYTLINAAYRGVQDARTCIRYFKKDAAENMNSFGIDPSKITIWGQGTGGYVGLACGSLDDYSKIITASDGKFLISDGMGGFIPMIIEGINGNIDGTSVGIAPPNFPPFPAGDTLCYPNHVGYDSDFQLSVNMGGAIADTSWLDPGQVPFISFQSPSDPFAPYVEGDVLVPVTPPLTVVEVQGSYLVQLLAQQYGLNDVFASESANFIDDISVESRTKNDGLEGLFPIQRPAGSEFDSSPWDYWDPATNPNHASGLMTNPDMTKAKAVAYMDTIIQYFAPRACLALGLNCDLSGFNTSIEEPQLSAHEVGLSVSPNPALAYVNFETAVNFPMDKIYIYDMSGKLVKAHTGVNSNKYQMLRNNLSTGMYIAKLHFENGVVSSKIVLK